MSDLPRLEWRLEEIGRSLLNRTDRLSADISNNNWQIERLRKSHIVTTAVWVAVCVAWFAWEWWK